MSLIRKIIQKYKGLSNAAKAGLWFIICNVLQRGVQFIVTPIYTRLLTPEQYGVYSLFITWMNLFSILGTLNLSAGVYYNGIIKNDRDIDSYTSSLQTLSSLCSAITFSLIFIINHLMPSLLNISYHSIILMFVYILVSPAIGFWSAQQRVLYKYRKIIIITLASSVIASLGGIILIQHTQLGGYGVVIAFVSVNVLINGYFFVRNFIRGHFYVSLQDWKETLNFSLPLIPHYLSQVILGQFDRIMINYYWGASKAGIYSLAYQVGLVMSILTSGINSAFTPWTYQQIKEKNYIGIKNVTNILFVFFLVVAAAITLVAPEIIGIIGSSEYREAMWAIPPVMMSSFVMFAYCAFGTILFYYEDTKRASIATTVGAVLNVILNGIFIPIMGYIAAGYTTLASYLLILCLYYLFMKKCCIREEVTELFDIKIISGILILLIVFSIISLFLYQTIWIRYIVFALLLIVLAVKRKKLTDVFEMMTEGKE